MSLPKLSGTSGSKQMLIDKLLKNIGSEEKEREWANPIRLSSAGKCARAIAYQLHYKDKLTPLSSRARMVFRLGDIIEAEIKSLLKKYPPEGCEIYIPDEQEEVRVNISGKEIIGHIDGRVKIDGVPHILEIKSISDIGFKNVLRGKIDYTYKCQATAYMKALGIPRTLFVYYNKNTSKLQEVRYFYEEGLWLHIVRRFTSVINSTPDCLPDREFSPNDKGKLPFQCSYCSACHLCWPEAEVKFDDDNKPSVVIDAKGGYEDKD